VGFDPRTVSLSRDGFPQDKRQPSSILTQGSLLHQDAVSFAFDQHIDIVTIINVYYDEPLLQGSNILTILIRVYETCKHMKIDVQDSSLG
jgi:hypothetical protein